ncbi:hypothetical protein J7E70_29360 [Variovorax paradoxus]|nr:hypothetical protein [Variovorax paradoxus]MBT2304539.1 hypothetical protein [Variovorax paradoxus]
MATAPRQPAAPQPPISAEEFSARRVEFFAACVNQNIANNMEIDKGLFALSAGAIGLLLTQAAGLAANRPPSLAIAYSVALGAFLVCVTLVMFIFWGNARHLEALALDPNADSERWLRWLDAGARVSFVAGCAATAAIAYAGVFPSPKSGEKMNDQSEDKGSQSLNESLRNLGNMSPENIKSVHGTGGMAPRIGTTQPVGSTAAAGAQAASTQAAASAAATAASASAPAASSTVTNVQKP